MVPKFPIKIICASYFSSEEKFSAFKLIDKLMTMDRLKLKEHRLAEQQSNDGKTNEDKSTADVVKYKGFSSGEEKVSLFLHHE